MLILGCNLVWRGYALWCMQAQVRGHSRSPKLQGNTILIPNWSRINGASYKWMIKSRKSSFQDFLETKNQRSKASSWIISLSYQKKFRLEILDLNPTTDIFFVTKPVKVLNFSQGWSLETEEACEGLWWTIWKIDNTFMVFGVVNETIQQVVSIQTAQVQKRWAL